MKRHKHWGIIVSYFNSCKGITLLADKRNNCYFFSFFVSKMQQVMTFFTTFAPEFN